MLKRFTTIAPLIAFFLVLVFLVEPPAIRPNDRIPTLRILRGDEVRAWRWPADYSGRSTDSLRIALGQVLGPSNREVERVSEVILRPDFLGIEWRLNDAVSKQGRQQLARQDVSNIFRWTRDVLHRLDRDRLELVGTIVSPGSDSDEIPVVKLTFRGIDVRGLRWDRVTPDNVYEVATSAEFAPGWGDSAS